jgi:carbamoyltransferase
MRTLGIAGIFHDATVALFEDGKIVMAVEEERLSREKDAKTFPHRALAHVLSAAKIGLDDVDAIGFYWQPQLDRRWVGRLFREDMTKLPGATASLLFHKHATEIYLGEACKFHLQNTARERGERLPPVKFLPHHECHAAAAYASGPFESAAVLVADGVGGESCTTLYRADPRGIERLCSWDLPHSLGYLYSAVTQHLGFKSTSEEWKVMGLAPYGGSDPSLDRFFEDVLRLLPDGGYEIDRRHTRWHKNPFSPEPLFAPSVEEHLGPARKPDEELSDRHRAIAYALQKRTEQAVFHVLRGLYERTKLPNLCYSGGVALNCVANGRILQETPFERVHVPYAPGDAGAALGAALLASGWHLSPEVAVSPYLGPSFDDAQIADDLRRSRVDFRRVAEPWTEAARLIAKGDIVGWFQGRMELGPRALGHRSILADARRADMKDRINAAVKFREGFRPFAPAVLAERASSYFADALSSPYMSFALKTTSTAIPATTHVDGTGRLQTVSADLTPSLHKLISAFERETGVPVVLNTSFNVKGEPIVCTPLDALRCFYSTGLDHLVIGSFVLSKTGSSSQDGGNGKAAA